MHQQHKEVSSRGVDLGNLLATLVRNPMLTRAYLPFGFDLRRESTLQPRLREIMKRGFVKLATAALVLVSSCAGVAGVVLANPAHADPDLGDASGRWCPGQELPLTGYPPHPVVWRMTVCHDWYTIFNDRSDTWAVIEGKSPIA